MFDDSYSLELHPYRHNIEVTEKRAPTDESVRLLREMESAARKEVLKSIVLQSNELKGVVHQMREPLSGDFLVAILFKLNGKDHRVDVRLNGFTENSNQKKIDKLTSSVSEYLSGAILTQIMTHERNFTMNFRSLISAIFPEQPSLEEFVNAHNPVTLHDVEFLEKKYSEIYSVPQIHNKDWIEP